ncbi:MAG: (d)CMP kinase, partial [Pseudomonadota bacterium]
MELCRPPIITIDGPSGTGKGTVSQLLAADLGWHMLDSGVLYRALALAAKRHDISLTDEIKLERLARHLAVRFIYPTPANIANTSLSITLEGVDVTDALRTEECGEAASIVASLVRVRHALLARQRAFCEPPGLVTDGRDMGSVVFKEAELKIFLVASAEERAKRRYNQLLKMGKDVNLDRILEEMLTRDLRDKNRAISPLKPADDAVLIDTTSLNVQQVLARIKEEVRRVFKISF